MKISRAVPMKILVLLSFSERENMNILASLKHILVKEI